MSKKTVASDIYQKTEEKAPDSLKKEKEKISEIKQETEAVQTKIFNKEDLITQIENYSKNCISTQSYFRGTEGDDIGRFFHQELTPVFKDIYTARSGNTKAGNKLMRKFNKHQKTHRDLAEQMKKDGLEAKTSELMEQIAVLSSDILPM